MDDGRSIALPRFCLLAPIRLVRLVPMERKMAR
jgi:hypothetical protein